AKLSKREVPFPWTGEEEEPNGPPPFATSEDGSLFAVRSPGGDVRTYDPLTGEQLRSLRKSEDIDRMVFSPDGKRIAGWREGGHRLQLWDAVTGEPGPSVVAPGGRPMVAVAFSPDGRRLALGLGTGPENPLSDDVAFSPGGVWLWDPRAWAT